jgi:Ion channel
MVIAIVAGALIICGVLWESFETIILPRRVSRRLRLTVLVYRATWLPWRAIAHLFSKPNRRETFLSFYGPLSLLILFFIWAVSLIFGFGLIYYGASAGIPNAPSFATRMYLSGTTLFTLGLGDVTPHTWTERVLVVVESGLGFAFLALVLSYLPVIYQAFSRREVHIVLLDARAGSPPTAAELLRRHSGAQGAEALKRLLDDWERSAAEILESHVSYPGVAYFRSQHNNESWLAAITAILDTTALLLTCIEGADVRQARLTFAICRHTVVDLAQVFNAAPRGVAADRLDVAEFERMSGVLTAAGFSLRNTGAECKKLKELREMYEPYLHALSEFLYMPLPPWILAKEKTDNWRTTAWGRITGFSEGRQEHDSHQD